MLNYLNEKQEVLKNQGQNSIHKKNKSEEKSKTRE